VAPFVLGNGADFIPLVNYLALPLLPPFIYLQFPQPPRSFPLFRDLGPPPMTMLFPNSHSYVTFFFELFVRPSPFVVLFPSSVLHMRTWLNPDLLTNFPTRDSPQPSCPQIFPWIDSLFFSLVATAETKSGTFLPFWLALILFECQS